MRVPWPLSAAVVAASAVAASTFAGSGIGGTASDARRIVLARLARPTSGYVLVSRDYGGRVYVTRDGRSWRDVTPTALKGLLEDAAFLDARHGWVVSSDCVGSAGVVVHRTGDGGRRWRSTRVTFIGCHGGAQATLDVLDERHAWLADGDPAAPFAELWRTSDGGATWSRVASGRRFPWLARVRFLDHRLGWLGRNESTVRQPPYETHDGGRTWKPRPLPSPHAWRNADTRYDVPTFFGIRGVLPVTLLSRDRSAVAFYVTTDGGARWALRAVRRLPGVTGYGGVARYVPASVASPDVWWIVGGRFGRVVELTRDGGRSWATHVVQIVPAGRSSAISAADDRSAWLTAYPIAGGSALFASTDGGRSWRRLTTPP